MRRIASTWHSLMKFHETAVISTPGAIAKSSFQLTRRAFG